MLRKVLKTAIEFGNISKLMKKMILVDSHCHLDILQKQGADISEIIANAKKQNVEYIQSICTKIEDVPGIVKIASEHANVFATVGVHPCNVDGSETREKIIHLAKTNPKVTGIGETGLDYYKNNDPKHLSDQKKSFIAHIQAAQITGLPVIVHARSADQDIADIMISEMKEKNFSGLIHCFTASKELAKKMLDNGIYISISGIVTFKNAQNLQDLVKKYLPLDRMLIETDSPYLAPSPMRGKTNQPSYVYYVAQYLSEFLGHSITKIAEQTTKNYFSVFSKSRK